MLQQLNRTLFLDAISFLSLKTKAADVPALKFLIFELKSILFIFHL